MSEEERLARIDENRMGLNLHLAIKRGLEKETTLKTATWKANEMIIQEFEIRISQLQGKQEGRWLTVDHQNFIEVVPESDEKTHGLGDECWCNPKVEQSKGVPLIIHYSVNEAKS